MNKNSTWEVKKVIQDFCPQDIEAYLFATARCVKLWSLNSNLFFKVAQISFQRFPRRRFLWVIITTLYQLML